VISNPALRRMIDSAAPTEGSSSTTKISLIAFPPARCANRLDAAS
jgi:hypothetical protein